MTESNLGDAPTQLFKDSQATICTGLEKIDGHVRFHSDVWTRPDLMGEVGGGGDTRILSGGAIFEKAGVNFSAVEGSLPADMASRLVGLNRVVEFFATGISLVIHPLSPMIPTTHANFRYLEVHDKSWFGGGLDLTPYYFFAEDATHFHRVIKSVCDRHDPAYYGKFKKWCDEYFFLPHRKEARGIGGIFFDYLGRENPTILKSVYSFVADLCNAFLECYLPIVERRRNEVWSEEQKAFQLIRRGRYVEFNLLYDRGTQFGLSTGGRAESILMSLPPEVRWEYGYEAKPGTREAELIGVLQNPRDWV